MTSSAPLGIPRSDMSGMMASRMLIVRKKEQVWESETALLVCSQRSVRRALGASDLLLRMSIASWAKT